MKTHEQRTDPFLPPMLDLEPALKQMHALGLADGDVGFAYWHQVAELLKSAAAMRVRLRELEQSGSSSGSTVDLPSSSGPSEQKPGLHLLHDLLSRANERRVAGKEPREQSRLSSDEKDWLKNLEAPNVESSGRSPRVSLEPRAAAAADEAEQLALAVDYYVVNSEVSPRRTLERHRIECDVPVGDGPFDVDIRVGDDRSGEVQLATWHGFSRGSMSLSEVALRCYCCASFGAPELPPIGLSHSDAFSEVVLAIHERTSSITAEPLLLLCACCRHGRWTLHWSRAYVEEGANEWIGQPAEELRHPLLLIWHVATMVDGPSSDETGQ